MANTTTPTIYKQVSLENAKNRPSTIISDSDNKKIQAKAIVLKFIQYMKN
mgnify:CR=1 FL=1